MGKHVAAIVLAVSIIAGGFLVPDAPDGSRYQLQGSKDTLADLGELAARIGSHDVWDRRGQVVWYDNFDAGLAPWATSGGGTGNSVRIDAGNTEFGGFAALLTAGSDDTLTSQIYRFFSVPEVNKWGVEVGVSLRTEFDHFRMYISAVMDGTKTEADVYLDRTNSLIKLRVAGGGYETLGVLSNPISTYPLYHQLKVVGDFDTGKYVRVLYDGDSFDASAYALYTEASAEVDNQKVLIALYGRSGSNDGASIGHGIITVGEP